MEFKNAHYISYVPEEWLTFDDVLIMPQKSFLESRNDSRLDLTSKFTRNFKLKTPIISANMDTITGADMVCELAKYGAYGILHRFYPSKEDFLQDCEKVLKLTGGLAFSIGAGKEEMQVIADVLALKEKLYGGKDIPMAVCIDIAHGHLQKCIDQVTRVRANFKDALEIIAGNVCTPSGAYDLIRAGVDAIKVGVGNGSLCSTRIVTGHGIPQLTAIINCRQAINSTGTNVALIADGGIRTSGDIVKALAAGADSVMIGGMFAGKKETPGPLYFLNEKEYVLCSSNEDFHNIQLYKKYRGQSSKDFLNDIGKTQVSSEGEHKFVPVEGSVVPVLQELVGGIRSGLTYSGCFNLVELSEKCIFIVITNHGFIESTPHGKN